MGIVSVILLIIFVIASLLLILVVLVQDEQGEGLGGIFGGSSASFGPRRGNVLTRFTAVLGAVFVVGALAVAWVNRTPEAGDVARKARLEKLKTEQSTDWFVESTPSGDMSAGQSSAAAATGSQEATTPAATSDAAAQGATGSTTQGTTTPETTAP